MKLIRIIIALFGIYLFVGSLFLLGTFFVWLNRFYADIPTNTIANFTTTKTKNNKEVIQFNAEKGTTAFSSMITRGEKQNRKSIQLFTTEEKTLFVTYSTLKLRENFIPLGFTSMYRIQSIHDSVGKEIYLYKTDFIDWLMSQLLNKIGTRGQENLVVVASPETTSYTVTLSTEGIKQYEN